MAGFKLYERTGSVEAKPWEESDGDLAKLKADGVSVSVVDIEKGSPKFGDMIARNPVKPDDKWLIEKDFFANNYVSE
jgi:hypothetical protein